MTGNSAGAWRWGVVAVAMFALAFAVAPLYGAICRAAGFQSANTALPGAVRGGERYVTVRFDARVQSDLPWEFVAEQRSMRVRVGQWHEARFRVRNRGARAITGQAVASVIPARASAFFAKAECFCFRQQTVGGGEGLELPLRFQVSAGLPDDVESLTVAYAFMPLR